MSKVAIIGVGHVGRTTAFYLASQNLVKELVLIDIVENKANADYLDIDDALVNLGNNVKFYLDDYSQLKDADYLILSFGNLIEVDSLDRLSELKMTSKMLDDVAPKIKESGFNGFIISITNPCDVIVSKLQEYLNYPTNKIMGSGTLLDSNRLKNCISRKLNVSVNDVNAYIVGEHGESQVPLYSIASVNNKAFLNIINNEEELNDILKEARFTGWKIFKAKQCTAFGIAVCVSTILKAIKNNTNQVIPVSNYDKDNDVFYGWPCIINSNGVERRLDLKISEKEQDLLNKSIATIKKNVSLKF